MLSSNELHETSVWSGTASYLEECKIFRFVKIMLKKLTIASFAFIIQFNH